MDADVIGYVPGVLLVRWMGGNMGSWLEAIRPSFIEPSSFHRKVPQLIQYEHGFRPAYMLQPMYIIILETQTCP